MTQRDDQGRFTGEVPESGTVRLLGWPNGLNKTAHPARLAITELAEAQNINFGPRGELILRPGRAVYSVFDDTDLYVRLFVWATDSLTDGNGTGEDVFIAVHDDTTNGVAVVYRDALAARQEVKIASASPGDGAVFIPFAGKGYFTSDLASSQVEIDPAGVSPTALSAWDPDSGSTTTAFPRSDVMMTAYERLFATRVRDLDSDAKWYRLYFSEPLLPKSWTTTNYIDINPDDEQRITALRYFADQIVIFKERSIWGLSGDDFEGINLQLYNIENSIGTSAPLTIVDIGELLMFMDPSRGIYLFDGSAMQNVGESIFEYIQDNFNSATVYKASAWFHDGRYHLTVPWASDTYPSRTFVYDVNLQAWTEWTVGFRDVAILPEGVGTATPPARNRAIAISSWEGFQELSDEHTTDDTAIFQAKAETGWRSPSSGASQHRIRTMQVSTIDTPVTITIKAYTEFDTDTAIVTENLDASAGENDGIVKRTHAFNGFRWRNLMLEFSGWTTSSGGFQINSVAFDVSSLPRKRGTG